MRSPQFSLAEQIFLRLWCVRPPPEPYEPRDLIDLAKPGPPPSDPFEVVREGFGKQLFQALAGKTFLDIGCGGGYQAIAAAQSGAAHAVGVDLNQTHIAIARAGAKRSQVEGRTTFTTDPLSHLGSEWADVALSQNSFEHFLNPGDILTDVYSALKPGGKFFITFSPPWWHPFGVHHFFMIRLPWAHLFFSEETILTVRQLFRPNKPACWDDVMLNQMTISKLLGLIRQSGFLLTFFGTIPIHPVPLWFSRLRMCREWTTSRVSVILTKPPCGSAPQ